MSDSKHYSIKKIVHDPSIKLNQYYTRSPATSISPQKLKKSTNTEEVHTHRDK